MFSRYNVKTRVLALRCSSFYVKSSVDTVKQKLFSAAKGNSHSDFCKAMRAAGKVKLYLPDKDCNTVLRAFIEFSQRKRFNAHDICDVLHGTLGMSNITRVVLYRDYVFALVRSIEDCPDKLNGIHVSRCFNGLQHLTDTGNINLLLGVLTSIASEQEKALTPRILGAMLHGMRSMAGDGPAATRTLSLILRAIRNTKEPWSNKDIGAAFIGLRDKAVDQEVVRKIISALATKIPHMSEPVSALTLCTAVHSIKSMSTDHDDISYALDILSDEISRCDDFFSRHHIAMAFGGLQNMTNSMATRKILRVLVQRLSSCTDIFGPLEIAGVLYGVKGFSLTRTEPDSTIIQAVFQAILPHIHSCAGRFTSQTLGNCAYSLHKKSSDVPEVREVVAALVQKFRAATEENLDSLALATALYGLKSMHTSQSEVRDMLRFLTEKILTSTKKFSVSDIGMAMTGLYNCNSDYLETRQVAATMAVVIDQCDETFLSRHVCYCMLAVKNMSDAEPEVRQLLKALVKKFKRAKTHDMVPGDIAGAFSGMKRLHIATPDVQTLLELFLAINSTVKDPWLVEDIGNAFVGLSSMTNDNPLVGRALQAMVQRASTSCDEWSAGTICSAFLGVRSMSASTPEVVEFLRFMEFELVKHNMCLTPRQIMRVLESMSNMSSDEPAVRAMVVLMMDNLNRCKAEFALDTLERMYLGLKNMSIEHVEVEDLLAAMTRQLVLCTPHMDEVSLNYFLEGLQNKDVRSRVVRDAYSALNLLLSKSDETFDVSLIESWPLLKEKGDKCEEILALVNTVQDKSTSNKC